MCGPCFLNALKDLVSGLIFRYRAAHAASLDSRATVDTPPMVFTHAAKSKFSPR